MNQESKTCKSCPNMDDCDLRLEPVTSSGGVPKRNGDCRHFMREEGIISATSAMMEARRTGSWRNFLGSDGMFFQAVPFRTTRKSGRIVAFDGTIYSMDDSGVYHQTGQRV